ncbi:LysR family transcriptional regulator [Reyranella sp.]|uniref:LysR family transcriptional regulator n=1 Tax=Reyranella sp. TaxID=1929291 RepID=UPI0040359AFB
MINQPLRSFSAIARLGSIREAAEELHIAQSALSRQIQKLEEELGVPLFHRHARGVKLTSAGEIFLRHAQTNLRQIERVRSEIDALKGLRRGTVNIRSIESLVPHLLPRAMTRFSQRYPGIQFEITIDGSDQVVAAVREGRTDIGLAFYPPAEAELETAFKMREPLVAVMSAHHPLAGRPKVSLADCAAYPIALPMKHTGSHILIEVACTAAGIHISPTLETNAIQLRVEFVRVNHGITFLSRLSAWDSLRSGELVAVPIRDRLVNNATIDAITHSARQLPVAAEEFLRFLQGEFQDLHEIAYAPLKREPAAAGSARSMRTVVKASTGDRRS